MWYKNKYNEIFNLSRFDKISKSDRQGSYLIYGEKYVCALDQSGFWAEHVDEVCIDCFDTEEEALNAYCIIQNKLLTQKT